MSAEDTFRIESKEGISNQRFLSILLNFKSRPTDTTFRATVFEIYVDDLPSGFKNTVRLQFGGEFRKGERKPTIWLEQRRKEIGSMDTDVPIYHSLPLDESVKTGDTHTDSAENVANYGISAEYELFLKRIIDDRGM